MFFNSNHFFPEEIIFVPTQACNLHCSHCFVPKNAQKLNIEKAKSFLLEATNDKISRVGFSGGEPFLNIDFLCEIVKTAVENDLIFDRLMTNAVWWKCENELKNILQKLFNAGFDGTFGISFDTFHGENAEKVYTFIKYVENIWQNRNMINLVLVYKNIFSSNLPNLIEENEKTLLLLQKLSNLLGTKLIFEENETQNIENLQNAQVATNFQNLQNILPNFPVELRYSERQESVFEDEKQFDSIEIEKIAFIDENPFNVKNWQSEKWFTEDFCFGPGNVYYVHANGDIAACCGYANEEKNLILGNLNEMNYEQIKKNAKKSLKKGFLKTVYKTGLLKTAIKMEKSSHNFPNNGKTSDNCLFCRYLCKISEK